MKGKCFFIAIPGNTAAVSKQFMELSNVLALRGHRVVILISGQRKHKEQHATNPSIYTWPSKRPINFRDGAFLFRLIKMYRPDCLIANFGAVNIMMLLGWLMRVHCRIAWHHTLSEQIFIDINNMSKLRMRYLNLRKNIIYKMATHIVPVSNVVRLDVHHMHHVPLSKCQVIHNSLVDPWQNLNEQKRVMAKRIKIICVARLEISKGQDILIKAIALLQKHFPDITAEFVGEGYARNTYLKLSSDLNLDGICNFIGALSHDNVLKHMSYSYVTVVPSINEAFGLVNIESMAVGTPVIASNIGGIPEIIRDGIDGFLFQVGNHESLAEKLFLLLKNPDLRETMGKNARQRFLDKFELKNSVSQQVEWLERIMP